jgi:hypothetical protein
MNDEAPNVACVGEGEFFRKLRYPVPLTHRLRALLEERGIFSYTFVPEENRQVVRTCWKARRDQGGYCYFDEGFTGLSCANSGHLMISQCTPDEAVDATLGDRKAYDAGFTAGVQATIQQLYGLLHDYPTLDEIEAWADRQWEEEL